MKKEDVIITMIQEMKDDHHIRFTSIDKRLDTLEIPGKVFKYMKQVFIFITIVSGAGYSIIKLIDHFKQ